MPVVGRCRALVARPQEMSADLNTAEPREGRAVGYPFKSYRTLDWRACPRGPWSLTNKNTPLVIGLPSPCVFLDLNLI